MEMSQEGEKKYKWEEIWAYKGRAVSGMEKES